MHFFIVHKLDKQTRDLNSDFTLKDYLFGGTKLAKNVDAGKYSYSGYGIGFNSRSVCSYPDFGLGKNVVIFGVDNSSLVLVDNKKNDILVLGEGATRELDGATITTKVKYCINFSRSNRKLCLSLNQSGINSFLFINATKIFTSKQRVLK